MLVKLPKCTSRKTTTRGGKPITKAAVQTEKQKGTHTAHFGSQKQRFDPGQNGGLMTCKHRRSAEVK